MQEIRQRMMVMLGLISQLQRDPDQQTVAHSLMIHYMAFIAYLESSEYYSIVSIKDKMIRNDIAHTSVVPIANGLVVKKIIESIEQLKKNITGAQASK